MKSLRIFVILMLGLVLAMGFAACGGDSDDDSDSSDSGAVSDNSSFVGSWIDNDDGDTLTFESDGTFSSVDGTSGCEYSGTYEASDGVVSYNISSSNCSSSEGPPAGWSGDGTYVFEGDTLTVTVEGSTDVFTRIE